MIRAVTLNNNDGQGNATPDLHERVALLGLRQIDILCCQGVWRAGDDSEDETRILAKSLRMNSSFFAASHTWKRKTKRKMHGVRGLAILTGTGIWPLNSGSIQGIDESDGSKGIVQFALVRTNGASILVLNLQLCGSRQLQLLQLGALFSHPMLKERYGVVILCGDRRTGLSAKELQTITKRSHYTSHSPPPCASSVGDGLLWILVAGKQPVASVTIHNQQQSSSSLEFEIDRIAQDKNYKPYYLPLSLEEQWSRYKTNTKPSPPESIFGAIIQE